MLHYRLSRISNKVIYIFCIALFIMIIVYNLFFMLNAIDMNYVITKNSDYAKQDTLVDVISTTNNKDGTIDVELSATSSMEYTTESNKKLLSIYNVNKYSVRYETDKEKGNTLLVNDSVLTGTGNIKDTYYEYEVLGEKLKVGQDDKICDVLVNDKGTFTVEMYSENKKVATKDIDELYGVSVVQAKDNSYIFKITNASVIKGVADNVNYIALDKNDNRFKFSLDNRQLLHNISSDFYMNMLIEINFFIVLGANIFFIILLYFAYKTGLMREDDKYSMIKLLFASLVGLLLSLLVSAILFV